MELRTGIDLFWHFPFYDYIIVFEYSVCKSNILRVNSGFLLLLRVIATTFCVTLAASLAARLGPTSMAAFQVCLQVWLATSLLADGLAVAGQVRTLFLFLFPFLCYFYRLCLLVIHTDCIDGLYILVM